MTHSSEKRWAQVQSATEAASTSVLNAVTEAEAIYQDLLELHAFAGSTAQLLADQLFAEEIAARQDAQANIAEVAKTQDAIDVMTAIHDFYQAGTNVAVGAADRFDDLRRFT